ncbi:MAG: hypothetical protein LIO71_04485 [Ruminococcus sp.]|nr:hypothetical protein [Ruminococcus sp.]MCD7800675.1 hypothetical protein [Ruminococcus sp.]
MKISIDNLDTTIMSQLNTYNNEITKSIKKQTKLSMKELVSITKDTAPVGKRTKHYKDSITSKKVLENNQKIVYRWYVKGSDYRLSHLINNGHALRNGGRYNGTQFIDKAYNQTLDNYSKSIEEIFNR